MDNGNAPKIVSFSEWKAESSKMATFDEYVLFVEKRAYFNEMRLRIIEANIKELLGSIKGLAAGNRIQFNDVTSSILVDE